MLEKQRLVKILAVISFLITVILLIVSGREGKIKGQFLGKFGLNFFAPIENLFFSAVKGVADVWEAYFDLIEVNRENSRLNGELEDFHSREAHYKELEHENRRLKELLGFKKDVKLKFIPAKVTGKDSSKWFNTVIINRGAKSGIKERFPVVVPSGVVGQVIEVGDNYSKVLLITDKMSGVDALVQSTRANGVLEGTGESLCRLKYFRRKFEVRNGDVIITSGFDQIYPKGLVVGEVVSVKRNNYDIFQQVFVKPGVAFDRLEEVLVISNAGKLS